MSGRSAESRTSFVRALHPLVKMAAAGALTVAALALTDPVSLVLLVLFLLAVLVAARVRVPVRLVSGGAAFLLVASGVNYLVSRDAAGAAHYALRVAAVALATPVMAATTAPQDAVRALARCRVPHGIAVALLLVWRFFPVLARESHSIHAAERLRGRRGGRAWRGWTRAYLVPLACVTVDHADRVALALELRGFDPASPRTWYRVPVLGWRDALFAALFLAVLVTAVLAQAWEWPR